MNCRKGCGACCIALSISSSIPGMDLGKESGIRCIQLDENNLCKLFDKNERPLVCSNLVPSKEMCKESFEDAMKYLYELEELTKPN